jgi:peptidoglycan hydrolase CwlO-like protein
LTPEGCSLPEEMRPFTCVKVNCEKLNKYINTTGKTQQLNQLKNALDKIHREVSSLINGINLLSSQHSHAHQKIKNTHKNL